MDENGVIVRIVYPNVLSLEPRRRALERLYERRETVRTLIAALEGYQRSRETRLAQCITLTAIPAMSQSSFSRSRI